MPTAVRRWRHAATIAAVAIGLFASSADGLVREQLPLAEAAPGDAGEAVPVVYYVRLHYAIGETVATGAGLGVHGTLAGLDAWSARIVTLAEREPGR